MRGLLLLVLMSAAVRSAATVARKKITLVTFDVDGTLIQGSSKMAEVSKHAQAFMFAVGKTFMNTDALHEKHATPLSVISPHRYHGCTDGLIALTVCRALSIDMQVAVHRLPRVYKNMYDFYASFTDDEAVRGTEVIEGVIATLTAMKDRYEGRYLAGLVTGNVEGIARKKMRATGIYSIGALSPKASDQDWAGEDDHSFLGGFGSDFCSMDVSDESRIYKDRGEQIAIAYRRAKTLLAPGEEIVRVVHVGDAPADVLASRYCFEQRKFDAGVVTGCIAVCTGKFSREELTQKAGERSECGGYLPVVLDSVGDAAFLASLGMDDC